MRTLHHYRDGMHSHLAFKRVLLPGKQPVFLSARSNVNSADALNDEQEKVEFCL